MTLAACSRAPQRSFERVAILPFDNLTGDSAFDWLNNAGPAMLSEELTGGVHMFSLRAPSVGSAALLGATRLLHCTFSQHRGVFNVHFALEDLERHRMIATGSADGTVLFAMSALARTSWTPARSRSLRQTQKRWRPGAAGNLSAR